jgi:hypothetical protein
MNGGSMKNALITLILFFTVTALWAKSPVSFTKFSLDDTKDSVEKVLKAEYKGKYTVDEWGGYTVDIGAGRSVEIGMEDGKVTYVSVKQGEGNYIDFLKLQTLICQKHGNPAGYYSDEEGLTVYWYAADYAFDHRISLSSTAPYSWTETVFYGK